MIEKITINKSTLSFSTEEEETIVPEGYTPLLSGGREITEEIARMIVHFYANKEGYNDYTEEGLLYSSHCPIERVS